MENEDKDLNIEYVDINKVIPNPYQPRKIFDAEALNELADSIKQYGILQPVNVRRLSEDSYELIAGERRTKAARIAGLTRIPVIITQVREEDAAILAIIENIQRKDLNFMEEAESYLMLISDHGLTQEELAKKIGKTQSTVANKMRLLKLNTNTRHGLIENKLTERHARALLKIDDEEIQELALAQIIKKGLNVKESEILIERMLSDNKQAKRRTLIKGRINYNLYINTIKNTYKQIINTGFNMQYSEEDKGEYVEITLKVPKS